jgi:hypothetical protein
MMVGVIITTKKFQIYQPRSNLVSEKRAQKTYPVTRYTDGRALGPNVKGQDAGTYTQGIQFAVAPKINMY